MPTVLFINGFRFYFFSNEGNEPMHVLVKKGSEVGKIWLKPTIEWDYHYGFTSKEINSINNIISGSYSLLTHKWNAYFRK